MASRYSSPCQWWLQHWTHSLSWTRWPGWFQLLLQQTPKNTKWTLQREPVVNRANAFCIVCLVSLLANKRWWRWGWRWVWSLPWLREASTSRKWRRPHSAQAVKCPRTAPWGGSMLQSSVFVPIYVVLEPNFTIFSKETLPGIPNVLVQDLQASVRFGDVGLGVWLPRWECWCVLQRGRWSTAVVRIEPNRWGHCGQHGVRAWEYTKQYKQTGHFSWWTRVIFMPLQTEQNPLNYLKGLKSC